MGTRDLFWDSRALAPNPNVMTRGAASTKSILLAYGKRIYEMISDADNILGHKNTHSLVKYLMKQFAIGFNPSAKGYSI